MTNLKKEDSPVAPAAPTPKDPIAELKAMLEGFEAKLTAMEGHMSKYDPSYGRGVDGKAHAEPMPEETEVQHPGEDGTVVEKNPLKVEATGGVNKEEKHVVKEEEEEEEEEKGKLEKAEPIKTLPIYQGQKKQENKELGPNKVSGAQYLNKEDVEAIVSSVIAKMGFTETPKAIDPVRHPLEKMEGTPEKFDMASLGSMKFEKVNEIAQKMMGGPRVG